ncbi:23S rRNA (pseudouridine(1915)-N(3))-methyltransferase RlmH [Abyssibius alkaniclasticus]|uniref:23S rRNA (pseudouridine(1915)-N(3))-methyltransferase RlmH n=1 Tax=Abyssibius alkaniclasticus TaxID=2881234 RepID=UPI0023643247|nr:23S rRNA (pseudouridine(1915)-N(3))-methyltransferase RlmH [Abyssibius alkaniclasticus]UPH72144.1 23S rRNA (pseudouridine(1915)-N(3))-methyltransferase RlmH [Abyssibius alkaniclasticus]|tara:strand:+ start:257 stop:727 length:471 start_codon:yes stop_codon:yes gene_type:complete
MRVLICAIGRQKGGPEAALITDYLTRFERTGRALGLGPAEIVELDDRKGGGMAAEADLLRTAIPRAARIMVLDERGKQPTSPQFAETLAGWRDTDNRELAILIGGADGLHPGLRAQADYALSLGKMVWPHMLARVMLAEQLYRAATILAGGPYHRS